MLQLDNTIPPHTGDKIIYAGAVLNEADMAMILLHGRGAGAVSMTGLIEHIFTDRISYVLPEAHNLTWYPYRFIEKRGANEPGISSGLTLIDALVQALGRRQIPREKIYLLGFSQGACLAADYIARHPSRFGGIFILSGGLVGDRLNNRDYQGDLVQTPVFLGCSTTDFHIPETRVHESAAIFETLNAAVTKRLYPGLGHTINRDELDFVNHLLSEKTAYGLQNIGS